MKKDKFKGILHKNPKGFGFVSLLDKKTKDVFISKNDLKDAIDEDIVEIEIISHSAKGPEGKIVKVIKRQRNHFVGVVISKTQENYVLYIPSLGKDKNVVLDAKHKLKIGDKIKVSIKSFKDKNNNVTAIFEMFLAHISDPSKDTFIAIEEYNIRDAFSKEVIDEAKLLKIEDKDLLNREDFTKENIVTIDPDTAKDYDDAISISEEKNKIKLGVHIADVAYFVKPDSNLDIEAEKRGNSTYFPNRSVPMLPKELSSDLCSLKEDEIRLTQSVLMEFDLGGTLLDYKIVRSYIKSKKRFTYKQALKILNSEEEHEYKKELLLMKKLCKLLKKKRFERGSIDFAIDEAKVIVDKNENPLSIEIIQYDITHQMIEEFMLKANETVATHLSKTNKTLIYRIHEEPNIENFQDFYDLAVSLGFHLPLNPTNLDIQKLFIEAKDTQYLQRLSINFIRNLRLAIYSKDNIGHFGLALEYYTHFTSPIRRYSDLIIQRLLFNEKITKNFEDIAKNCSEKERNSFKAESSVNILKKFRLLKSILKKDPKQTFIATVTRVRPFAIVFELDDYYLEGYLHISKIQNDFYEYNEEDLKFIGQRFKNELSFGTKIKVKVLDIDLLFMQIDFKFIKIL